MFDNEISPPSVYHSLSQSLQKGTRAHAGAQELKRTRTSTRSGVPEVSACVRSTMRIYVPSRQGWSPKHWSCMWSTVLTVIFYFHLRNTPSGICVTSILLVLLGGKHVCVRVCACELVFEFACRQHAEHIALWIWILQALPEARNDKYSFSSLSKIHLAQWQRVGPSAYNSCQTISPFSSPDLSSSVHFSSLSNEDVVYRESRFFSHLPPTH